MRVFIELPTWLGDSVMASAAIENIVANYPDSKITFFGKSASCELFSALPNCELLITDNSKSSNSRLLWLYSLAKKLQNYDITLSFRSHFASKFLLFFIKAKQKALFKYQKNELHQVEKYLNFTNHALGLKELNSKPKLRFSSYSYAHPTLGINAGASYGSAKRWEPEKFAALASALAFKYDIIIFGGSSERDICKQISAQLSEQNIAHQNLCAKTSIKELCEHIAGLSLFITNDSGPMHIASAFGVKTLAIFGPTNWIETAPYDKENSRILRLDLPCSPCMKRVCPLGHHACMDKLTAPMALAKLSELGVELG